MPAAKFGYYFVTSPNINHFKLSLNLSLLTHIRPNTDHSNLPNITDYILEVNQEHLIILYTLMKTQCINAWYLTKSYS